jgi:hypothetical protein
MKPNRLISVLVIFTTLITSSAAQNINCNVRRAFAVKKGSALQFANKYGDVNIITTKDDSLTVCATITIIQDNPALVQKNLKLISIGIEDKMDTIYVSTVYDKKFFSEELRTGRKSFSTDYLIKLPEYLKVSIKDEFGNISLDELSGPVNIRLSQGSLNAKKLTRGNVKPVNSVYADHAKIIIDNSNWMIMNLISCPSIEIGKAQALSINSTNSKINIGELSSLVSISKSDNITTRSINNFVAEGTYSTFEIGSLNGQLKSVISYGILKLRDVKKNFTGIDITSDNSQISVRPGIDASFKADISTSDGSVELPSGKYPLITKTAGPTSVSFIGFAGNDKNPKSTIKIRATNGKVVLE